MAKIKFSNGVTVNFNGTPTQQDVEEIAIKLGIQQPKKPFDILNNSVTRTIQNVFPGQKVGEAIGTLGGLGIAKAKETLGIVPKGTTKQFDISAPSPLQVAGDVAKGASMVAGLKLPVATSVLGKATQFGGLSAVSGAGESAVQKNEPYQIAIDAFKSGLTGAVIGGAVGVAEKGIKSILERSPEALYNNALRITQKLKTADKSPSQFLIDKGTWGNLGTIYKTSQEGINLESSIIKNKLAPLSGGLDYQSVVKSASTKLEKSLGSLYSEDELKALIENVPVAGLRDSKGILDWISLDKIRSQLGGLIGDSKWMMTTPSPTVKASKAVYGALADAIQKVSGTEKEFANLTKWITTSKSVQRAIDMADNKFGLGLYDFISGGAGAVLGGLTGEGDIGTRLKNAALGGAVGLGLERGINSPALKTGLAQLLTHIDSIPTDSAGKISKTLITQLIGKLIPQSSE